LKQQIQIEIPFDDFAKKIFIKKLKFCFGGPIRVPGGVNICFRGPIRVPGGVNMFLV
jgi:hypothetical protein